MTLEAFDALCLRAIDRQTGRDYVAIETWPDEPEVGAVPMVEIEEEYE